jgi:NADPH:quinone reductase-like Zn-dependent oxidoreductase
MCCACPIELSSAAPAEPIPALWTSTSIHLVRVRAAGVNPLDSKIRDGEFRLILPYRPPFVLGHDVAGVVTRVGPDVRNFTVGDEIYARRGKDRIGTFAELIALDQDDLALKPTSLSMQEAAAVPLVGLTVGGHSSSERR